MRRDGGWRVFGCSINVPGLDLAGVGCGWVRRGRAVCHVPLFRDEYVVKRS